MKNYYKIMLGQKSSYAEQCYTENFIGAHYGIDMDLSNELSADWRDFNHKFIPIYLEKNPTKTKIGAGLACGALWTVCKGINIGDIVLCPDGHRNFLVGEVAGDYIYSPGKILPHRRAVKWYDLKIKRSDVGESLRNSTSTQGTASMITKHAAEIEQFIYGNQISNTSANMSETIENLAVFALEKHLEDFLVKNWASTELGKTHDILEEDGEIIGQQYLSDTGPIDILAISKDRKELLVVELKKGRASDAVIGQTQRYMGYIQEEIAEESQVVKGAIIALEDDHRIKRALKVAPNISFYRYQINFKLLKG